MNKNDNGRRRRRFTSRRRITRYNESFGPDFSSGVLVLTVFFAAVVLLSAYFVFNTGDAESPGTGNAGSAEPPITQDIIQGDTQGDTQGDIQGGTDVPGDGSITVSVSNSEIARGDLILVNKQYDYVFGDESIIFLYGNELKSSAYGLATVNISCAERILPYFNSMLEDYVAATGDDGMVINSGHRTYEDQNGILQSRIESVGEEQAYAYVALPGKSEHHTGYAVDIASHGENNDPDWLPENCRKYGFIQRYQRSKEAITGIAYEYWHYRYVGAPHAEIMYASELCLEEYIVMLYDHSYDSPLEYESEDGGKYMIYYTECKAGGDEASDVKTEIKIPGGFEYTISGNNIDGFIVTVTISEGETQGGTQDGTQD